MAIRLPFRRRRSGAQRERHRDPQADQLDQEPPDLGPRLQLGRLDRPPALVDHRAERLRDSHQRVQRGRRIPGDPLPGIPKLRMIDPRGRRDRVLLRPGECPGQRVPAIRDVPGRRLIPGRPVDPDDLRKHRLGHLEGRELQRMRNRARENNHPLSLVEARSLMEAPSLVESRRST
jgi:hypothetical protein